MMLVTCTVQSSGEKWGAISCEGAGAEAAGVFYGSADNLFSGTSLWALFYDIINSSISSDQP